MIRFYKQPAEILDYDVRFSDWFVDRTDAPASQVVSADPGITVVSSTLSGSTVKVVLSGGAVDQDYKVTVRLTTSSGLVKESEFQVTIREL